MVDRQTAARLDEIEERLDQLEAASPTDVAGPDVDATEDDPEAGVSTEDYLAELAEGTPASADWLKRNHSRDELDRLAAAAGIESPDKLPNKGVVADHIAEAIK